LKNTNTIVKRGEIPRLSLIKARQGFAGMPLLWLKAAPASTLKDFLSPLGAFRVLIE
jgi:hypothetical protein